MFSTRTVLILFFCLYVLSVECGGGGGARSSGGGYAKSSSGGGKSAKSQGAKGFLGEPVNGKLQNGGSLPKTKPGGRFLSAWGIISLIMLVIVGSALIYYTSIFYPLVCAERGKYDVMEMTAV
ncbi:uncharacterized protein LOC106660987 [Cimex lectularius]|uniref:Uncharacterized protein n=1 Tax=Cimex lectularius TaxID=79782 RepID=A0A8I6RAL4_CIMLE|nr:uncharacterized protein LOC106660987 [Cimex lectularius]